MKGKVTNIQMTETNTHVNITLDDGRTLIILSGPNDQTYRIGSRLIVKIDVVEDVVV